MPIRPRRLSDGSLIRPFRATDREAVRTICCETGFLGAPVDPLFSDREVFADFLTSYYTDREAESAAVLEVDGAVAGYVLGCRRPRRYEKAMRYLALRLAPRVAWRYLFRYGRESRRYIHWLLLHGRAETPSAPPATPHFHINLLGQARDTRRTRALIDAFLTCLADNGESRVCGQMVTVGGRRGERMFARYGFRVTDRRCVSKFRNLTDEEVSLVTVEKDLEANPRLYGLDLEREDAGA